MKFIHRESKSRFLFTALHQLAGQCLALVFLVLVVVVTAEIK